MAMSDVKPKRPVRPLRPSEISSGERAAIPSTATAVPEDRTVPEIASAPPAAPAAPVAEVIAEPPAPVVQAALEIVPKLAEPRADSVDDPWTAFTEAQAVLGRGFEEIVGEIAGMTRSGIAAVADAAVDLLGVRTFSEAVEINALLARRGIDAMIDGSAKLSEIGVKAVSEASQPMLSRLGESWGALARG
jgi:hypothetical protein